MKKVERLLRWIRINLDCTVIVPYDESRCISDCSEKGELCWVDFIEGSSADSGFDIMRLVIFSSVLYRYTTTSRRVDRNKRSFSLIRLDVLVKTNVCFLSGIFCVRILAGQCWLISYCKNISFSSTR